MQRDLKNDLGFSQSVNPAAHTATVTGSGVDLQGFRSSLVEIVAGTVTDGTHTPKLQESDDNSTFSDVAADDLLGSFAAIASNTHQKVGYIGNKRYVRAVVTVSGATTGAVYGAVIAKGDAEHKPVS